ncbi:MAG: Ig-like domain-containing protein [Myxococcota bacterium]
MAVKLRVLGLMLLPVLAACTDGSSVDAGKPLEECWNGEDDDGDGQGDCADSDCASDIRCQSGRDGGNGSNQPPVAGDDTFNTNEDVALVLTPAQLTANDTDPDGDNLRINAVGNAQNGRVALSGGQITFTPDPGFKGLGGFTYTVGDGRASDQGAVTVNVVGANDPPVVADDEFTVYEDGRISILTAELTANDVDEDGDELTVTAVTTPAHGTATLADTGVVYVPEANFHGSDSFQVTISDGQDSATSTVNITVTSINDIPLAANDTAETDEDTPLLISDATLLANDTDLDGDDLRITAVGNAVHGTVTLVTGQITFTPEADFVGEASFEYSVKDNTPATSTGVVTVTVLPLPDVPRAVDDLFTLAEDTPLTVTVAELMANDVEPDGDPLSFVSVGNAIGGTVTAENGDITFTPTAELVGNATFEYVISDGTSEDTGLVRVTYTRVNDPPVANPDTATTDEDTPVNVHVTVVTANDLDPEGAPLRVIAAVPGEHGTVSLSGGQLRFTPEADFHGEASFGYRLADDVNNTVETTVTVTVNPVNDTPVANDDAFNVAEDARLELQASDLVANDTDVDGDSLTVSAVSMPFNGTVSLEQGAITFTPTAGFSGVASFTYTLSDGITTDTAQVSVAVGAVNDPPVAVDDVVTTNEDTEVQVAGTTLLGNDADPDTASLIFGAISNVTGGTAEVVGGTVTFTPDPNLNGTGAGGFDYEVSDGEFTDVGHVRVDITAVNDLPVATGHSLGTNEDEPLVLADTDLSVDDTDVDNDLLVVESVQDAVNGTVDLASGTITFTPDAHFSGAASFTYTIFDGTARATALVQVTVTEVNDEPVAAVDALTTDEEMALNISDTALLANDTDADLDTLQLTGVQPGTGGDVALSNGTITFTPTQDFFGSATFTYTVEDGRGGQDTGTVNVTVNNVPDCGDGLLDPGEACDNGGSNSDTVPDACRMDCTLAACGDDVTDSGERCDDGNLDNGDGCDSNCTPTACGNGILTDGETCYARATLDAPGAAGLASADLDGDGWQDLVAGNGAVGSLRVWRGGPASNFTSLATLTVGDFPREVAVAELNGDGIPDLVTVGSTDGTVTTILGMAGGGFLAPVTQPGVASPVALATGDFDDDLLDEVVIASGSTNEVTILYSDGTGGFRTGETITLSAPGVQDVAVADLHGDGLLDVLTTNGNTDELMVNQAISSNAFAAAVSYPVGAGARGIVVGDLDGDTDLDVAVAAETDDVVTVIRMNAGVLVDSVDYSAGTAPVRLVAADVDDDNALDLLARGPLMINTLINNGSAVFAAPVVTNVPAGTQDLVTGDWDGDGVTDLAFSTTSIGITLAHGRNNGNFPPRQGWATDDLPFGVAVAQLDGVGYPEVLVVSYNEGTLHVFGSDGSVLTLRQTYAVQAEPLRLVTGDLNGDGHLDVVVTNYSASTISVLLGMGDGTLAPQQSYAAGLAPFQLALGYVNADSILDLLVTSFSDNQLVFLAGNGDGTFAPAAFTAVCAGPGPVAIHDVDGNGSRDVVLGCMNTGEVQVLPGNGDGTLGAAQVYTLGSTPQDLALGDLDGDGALDLVTSSDDVQPGVNVLRADGNGAFLPLVRYPTSAITYDVELADVDGDGNLDVVTTPDTVGVDILLGNGDATLQAAYSLGRVGGAGDLAVKDLNGDGAPEILVSDTEFHGVVVIRAMP